MDLQTTWLIESTCFPALLSRKRPTEERRRGWGKCNRKPSPYEEGQFEAEGSLARSTNSKSICHVNKPTQEVDRFSVLLLSSLSTKSILPTHLCLLVSCLLCESCQAVFVCCESRGFFRANCEGGAEKLWAHLCVLSTLRALLKSAQITMSMVISSCLDFKHSWCLFSWK